MSADDNLASAALGALEGFSNVFIPYQKSRYDANLEAQKQARQLANEQALAAYKNPLDIQKEKEKQSGELQNKLTENAALYGHQTDLEKSRDYSTGQDILDSFPNAREVFPNLDPAKQYPNKLIVPQLQGRMRAKQTLGERMQNGETFDPALTKYPGLTYDEAIKKYAIDQQKELAGQRTQTAQERMDKSEKIKKLGLSGFQRFMNNQGWGLGVDDNSQTSSAPSLGIPQPSQSQVQTEGSTFGGAKIVKVIRKK